MADNDDDDEFGLDDALDDLPDDDLYELEREAFLSTQHVQNRSHVLSTAHNLRHLANEDSFASDKTLLPNNPPSDYGFDDEDIIDLDEQPPAVQQAYNQALAHNVYRVKEEPHALGDRAQEGESYKTAAEEPHADVAALQTALLKVCSMLYAFELREEKRPPIPLVVYCMEAFCPGHLVPLFRLCWYCSEFLVHVANDNQAQTENLNLRRAIDETSSTVQSKTGENAILRQKLDKQARDSNQKESTIRQLYEEQLAKQKAETERIKGENQKVITDNRFLEHDLALEAGKAKQLQRNLKASGVKERASPASTPKRNRTLPFRDGFDDDDVLMFSPSKPRSKPSTPKGGTKRKRLPNEQSPMQPPQLPLSEPKPILSPSRRLTEMTSTSNLLRILSIEEDKLQVRRGSRIANQL
jgi:hypothetical protein